MSTTSQPAAHNRLRAAASPYLRQHADNPVEWYEWGPEALARARAEDKPIFLSIGYAACHWCHVMAHESFADEATAAVLNRLFVNIKVDREERPDLDEIYMRATVVLNQGQGGWPMSVWLTPDLKPFFAGTYFPPTARYGRPGFRELCERIGQAWAERRTEITAHADQLTLAVRDSLQARGAARDALSVASVDETAEALAGAFDPVSGGLAGGGTNKFPPSMALELLLRSAVRRPADAARRQQFVQHVERTLDHMAAGGIYDQLGGGIHRYSTDVEWHVPHFEKMLYDQALVSRAYLDAYQFTGAARHAEVARGILDYVLRDLRAPEGGFYSSRDADSEGQEGRFYVWTRAQVCAVLDPETAELFCAHYDISESGNWDDPHDPGARKSIPRVLRDYCCCGKLYGLSIEDCEQRLARAREMLLAVRAQRVPPARDEKILCEWNGLMIASLARGGSVLGEQRYVDAAVQAADFILRHQHTDGRLRRAWCGGHATDVAFLSDYACLIEGLIELYEATFDRRWLDRARALTRTAVERFWDRAGGGFFFTSDDHEALIARSKEVADNAVPSGNSVMLMNLLRLATLLGDQELRDLAERQMAVFAGEIAQSPYSAERFLAAVDFACGKPLEIVIVGDPAQPATQALLRQARTTYLPNRVLALHNPAAPEHSIVSPLLADRTLVDSRPAAYVCRNYTCRQPVTTPEALAAELTR